MTSCFLPTVATLFKFVSCSYGFFIANPSGSYTIGHIYDAKLCMER